MSTPDRLDNLDIICIIRNLQSNNQIRRPLICLPQVVDTETWVQDLPASNLGGGDTAPAWYKLYTASTDLEMEGFTPQDWDRMVRRLASDQEYYDKVAFTISV